MSKMSCRPRVVLVIATVSFASVCVALSARAQESAASADSLARQVKSAPVSLARGLAAARARGNPISAKYELEEGKPQLSVYTVKGNRFWEVIVDHRTGRITKAEEIKEGDNLTAAKAQFDVFLVLYAIDVLGISAPQFGVLIAVQMTTAMLSYFPAARLADRRDSLDPICEHAPSACTICSAVSRSHRRHSWAGCLGSARPCFPSSSAAGIGVAGTLVFIATVDEQDAG